MLTDFLKTFQQKLRWSEGAHIYRCIIRPSYRQAIAREIGFFKKLVTPGSLVFDIGANHGSKTDLFLRLGAKKVVAVEPDPTCLRSLADRFSKNKRVEIVSQAIDSVKNKRTFFMCGEGSAYNTLSEKWARTLQDEKETRFDKAMFFGKSIEVTTITLDELIDLFGLPEIIKIDVEGFELQAIKGLSHKVGLLWFEANLPEFKEESVACIRHLAGLSGDYRFNYSINVTDDLAARLEFDDWATASVMINELQKTNCRFMEIFACSRTL